VGRGDVLDDGQQLGTAVFELPLAWPGASQAGDLGLADGLLAAGASG
jgi:hypothetical protein